MLPVISIIVPVYKVEPYLRRCVDSILSQTFTDFELILVDDGSPDGCGAICDEYVSKDSRILIIHQPNGGLSAARNSGIDWAFACSDSDWLGFVDSDDWVHPCYLEYLYRGVKENSVKISVCEYKETDAQYSLNCCKDYHASVIDGIDFFASEKNVIATVAVIKLYKKDLFTDTRYPVGKIHEDEYTTYKLLYRAGEIAYVKEQLYFYFINPLGITKKGYSLKRLDAIGGIEEQCRFFKEIGRHNYFEKWASWLVICIYPSQMARLIECGAVREAEYLREHGKKFVLQHLGVINKLDSAKKEFVIETYFPIFRHFVIPVCNLSRMISHGGLREAMKYYKQKFSRISR